MPTSFLRLQKMMAFLTSISRISAAERFALACGIVWRLLQPLHDGGGGGGLRRDLDALGLVQEAVDEALDLRRHGRREEQGLTREGEELADALDVGNEAHVEHAVGLVDDENFDAVEEQLAALEMVEQAARRGDHHIGAAIELAVLLVVGHAADQKRHGELVVLAENLEMLGDLCGKLARRLQDQRARHAGSRPASLEPRQHRQHEGCRLAGAGLGNAEHVASGDGVRYGLRLNGGRRLEARRGNGGQNLWNSGQVVKSSCIIKQARARSTTRVSFIFNGAIICCNDSCSQRKTSTKAMRSYTLQCLLLK